MKIRRLLEIKEGDTIIITDTDEKIYCRIDSVLQLHEYSQPTTCSFIYTNIVTGVERLGILEQDLIRILDEKDIEHLRGQIAGSNLGIL